MDGNYISTDIRYRDKLKSRRRSTSYAKIRTPGSGGARSRSVDVMGAGGGVRNSVVEEVGVGEIEHVGGGSGAGLLDEVFELPINVGGGEGVEGNVTGGAESVEVPLNVGVGAGVEESNDIGAVENMVVPGGEDISGGVEEVAGERPKESVNSDVGGAIPKGEDLVECGKPNSEAILDGGDANTVGGVFGMDGMETESGVGGWGVEGGAGGGGNGDSSGVEPIHHIPRWRLREILAHAEGECILLV